MKLLCLLVFVTSLSSLCAFGQSLVGTWQFVSAKETQADGTVVEYTDLDLRSNKIVNNDYFCVVTRNSDGSFRHAILGPYRVEGDLYTEILEYSSNTAWTGSRPVYRYELDGDLWIIRTTGSTREKREEVWRRVTGVGTGVEF
ncbi:MAG: hypothetical protein JSU96_06925 [Acidobacteriota bacterium]|nr:MAG: hypothetical protein JSU96_06925 [Acidobacteriota bacterium]